MKIPVSFVTFVTLGATVSMASAADITGKVTLTGAAPPEAVAPLDPMCSKTRSDAPLKSRNFVVAGDGGLADVYVGIKGLKGKSTGASAPAGVLDQVGCEYTPYIQAIQVGQKLNVKNSDPVLHNVHTIPSPSTGNKEANKAQLPKGPDMTFTFDNAEPMLRFKCDVHNWMFAYVFVVDHPYFAVSGKDGTFKISNVPAGEYTLEFIHRKTGLDKAIEKKVTVGSAAVKVDAAFEAPK